MDFASDGPKKKHHSGRLQFLSVSKRVSVTVCFGCKMGFAKARRGPYVLLVVDFGRVLWQETYDTEVLNGFRDAARKCKTNRCPISEKNEADEMRIWQFEVSSKLEPSRRERAFLLSNNEASRAYRKHRCFVLEGLISFNPSEQPKRLRLFWTIRSHYCYSNKDRSRFVF
jgi:hypothetical protein